MGMFDTYDNLNPDYIPDNSTPTPLEKYITINPKLPKPLYNVKGTFLGYKWNHGEYFDFNISVNSIIKINSMSLIFEKSGEIPDNNTVGEFEGQKAYNIVDAKSWTFVGKTECIYMWVEDDELIYDINGDKCIEINTDMTNKYILLNIFNFRWESIYEQESKIGESSITINVNEEISKKLTPGIYYCTVKICSEDTCQIKNKFMIWII